MMNEINDLKQALEASPGSMYLRLRLLEKMLLVPECLKEVEPIVQRGLELHPSHIELKEVLSELYFLQKKYSACIIVCEEIKNMPGIRPETLARLAKCHQKEGNENESLEVYQETLTRFPEFSDDELDQSYRLRNNIPGDDEIDDLFSKPDLSFADVGGMEKVKREIDLKIIKPLENADLYASYGKKVGGGILLYGPPGCGKTFIARATAGEIDASFINITLNDILDMWIGNSEKNLNRFFEMARANTPCVMFFDEIDALGAKRSDMRQSAGKNIINQFLAELDGLESDNEGILVIGATNMPWHLDTAFRRPGRFDRIIFVPPPDDASKEAILQLKLAGKPQQNIDIKKIARKAKDYSGADLNAIIDIAVEKILEDAIETGIPKPISTRDLLDALKIHRPSTQEWFTTAKNYALFANKSGLYDDILKYVK